jgi:hypothetical protein
MTRPKVTGVSHKVISYHASYLPSGIVRAEKRVTRSGPRQVAVRKADLKFQREKSINVSGDRCCYNKCMSRVHLSQLWRSRRED